MLKNFQQFLYVFYCFHLEVTLIPIFDKLIGPRGLPGMDGLRGEKGDRGLTGN